MLNDNKIRYILRQYFFFSKYDVKDHNMM